MKHKPIKQTARKRIGRLKTPSDVARFMAKCIKQAAKREPGEGNVTREYNLVNMSSQLLKAIEVSDLEKRIEELERKDPKWPESKSE